MGGVLIAEELSDIVTVAFKFSSTEKIAMLLALKELLARGHLVSPYDPELEEELGIYKEDDRKLIQDMVMALGMVSWYIKENYSEDSTKELLNINIFE